LHITTSRLILAPSGYFTFQNPENACAELYGQEIKGKKNMKSSSKVDGKNNLVLWCRKMNRADMQHDDEKTEYHLKSSAKKHAK